MLQDGTAARLLIRHFVRRFVDNDLLSAHADRHESLAFFTASLVSAGIFGAVLMGTKYLFGVLSASWVAVSAMDDLFVIVSVAMIVVGLTAAAQWDALAIDARDAAILGPLPIGHGTMVRAKAAANLLFGAVLVAAVTIPASLVFSFFPLASLRLATSTEIRVVVSHVGATVLAGLFAFIAVVALREGLRLLTGARGFARISPFVQVLLVICLTTLLLVVLGGSHTIPRAWLQESPSASLKPFVLPAVWFVGLAQALNGDVLVLAPVGGVVVDDDLSRFYLARRTLFAQLEITAVVGMAGTLMLATAAFWWNSRRPPSAGPQGHQRSRALWRGLSRVVTRTFVRESAAQAAFFFSLRVLLRSGPHRLTLAVGVAVALSIAIAVASGAGLERATVASATPLSVWALQPLVLIALAATLRHAMALPAELRANWIFHQCWGGHLHQCMVGAQRAAFIVVLAPAVFVLAPLHAYVMGPGAALFHALTGTLQSLLLLKLAMMGRSAPPFLSSYVRSGNVKSVGPIFIMAGVAMALSVAALERAAARAALAGAGHTLVLIVLVVATDQLGRRRLPSASTLTTDAPEPSAEPLRLNG